MPRDSKDDIRLRIHKRIRQRVTGTAERPRLAVFRSLKHISAQVIDDRAGHTMAAASSSDKEIRYRKRRECSRRERSGAYPRRARQREGH